MSGEAKTLKQVEAAQLIIRDVMGLLETFRPQGSRDTEVRFIDAAMTLSHRRLKSVDAELSDARYRAIVSPENTTIVSKEAFEEVRMFRALGPARLANLLKSRQSDRARKRHKSETEDDDAAVVGAAIIANEAALP